LIQSATTRRFRALFVELPSEVQREAVKAFRHFRVDPSHPGLHFKKLEGEDNLFSARVGLGYRALAVRKQDRLIWFWIGSHADYDGMI